MTSSEEIGETQFLAALLGIAEMVSDLPDTKELLESIVRIAPSLVRVDRCAILAYDEAAREFRTLEAFGPGGEGSPFDGLRLSEDEVPRLAQRLGGLHLPTVVKPDSREHTLPPALIRRLGVKAALLVPLSFRGHLLGVMWLDHSSQAHFFTSTEINVVQGIATQVALALESAQRVRALLREARRFEALARALADGVIVVDADLRILDVDRGAEELLGWNAAAARGRSAPELLGISPAEAAVAWTKEADAPSLATKELRLRSPSGERVACEVLMVPVRGEAGETAQVLLVLRRLRPEELPAEPAPAPAPLTLPGQDDTPRE